MQDIRFSEMWDTTFPHWWIYAACLQSQISNASLESTTDWVELPLPITISKPFDKTSARSDEHKLQEKQQQKQYKYFLYIHHRTQQSLKTISEILSYNVQIMQIYLLNVFSN